MVVRPDKVEGVSLVTDISPPLPLWEVSSHFLADYTSLRWVRAFSGKEAIRQCVEKDPEHPTILSYTVKKVEE